MKAKFVLVAATDINTFNEMVNDRLDDGWKFLVGNAVMINVHEDERGQGVQYSVAMLLEGKQK